MRLSVIVPVYNVEEFLPVCIDSLLKQSVEAMEILLVDDGSTDGSGQICDKFALRDPRIRVIHKENGGLSDARNRGVEEAVGTYIAFIDSDDFLHETMFPYLLNLLEEEDGDLAICRFLKTPEAQNHPEPIDIKDEPIVLTGTEATQMLYGPNSKKIQFTAVNKVYKRQLFIDKDIRYPLNRLHEDMFTTYKLVYNAKKVVVSSLPLYYYRQRGNSIMGVGFKERNFDLFDATASAVDFFQKEGEKTIISLAVDNHFRTLCRIITQLINHQAPKTLVNKVRQRLIDDQDQWRQSLSGKTRLRIALFQWLPFIGARLLRLKETVSSEG